MTIQKPIMFDPAGEPRMLHIWLPDGYFRTSERYPVLYCFDGHNLFDDRVATYGRSWRLGSFLQSWRKQLIVVGIECGHAPNQRLDEYGPYAMTIMGHKVTGRKGRETVWWMRDVLKPQVDRELRTWPHREATGIAGSSMGGLMALYAVVEENATFGKAACLSPSIAGCLAAWEQDLSRCALHPDTSVYLGWGGQEGGPALGAACRKVAGLLEEREARVETCELADGRHCEADWERQVPRFLQFLWF